MSKQYPGGVISKTPVVPTSLSAPGIWTLNQQAAAQNTNTWPFPRDPQFNYVTMLLHGDGSAQALPTTGVGAGASAVVTNFNADASTNNFNVTINGDTRSNNFTPYQADGYWSVGFTGAQTSPSLTYPSISAYDLGATSQFTYECWVYFASVSGEQSIFERFTGTGGPGWLLTKLSTNVYRAHFGSSVYIDTGAIAVAGQWIHLAVSRDGSTGSLFVDGIRQATTSSVVNFTDGTDPLVFGERNSSGQTFPFNGYISNARIVKGTYVYNPSSTSITVPTSPLTAITNTVFLGLQSYRYLDNSSNAATATIGSASSVQRISPFTQSDASLNTVATYGSGYFDGTGDWLQTPSNSAFNFSATDCTLEFWYYGAGASGLVFEFGSSTPDTAAMQCEFSSGTLTFKPIGASSSFFAIQTNAWNYIAAVKTGTTYYLYINGTRNTASTGTAASTGQIINIGARNGGSTAPITGYLSNFRVSNTARYTGTTMTVPTTPLSTDANTQLLINQYNGGGNNSGFKDSSQFNFPITRNGNTTQGTFTPYGSNWSNYFDGSSAYLSVATNAGFGMGTGDCTLECWYFPLNSTVGIQTLIDIRTTNTGVPVVIGVLSSGAPYAYNGTTYSGSTVTNNSWNHIAFVRNGSGTNNCKLYLNGTQVTQFTDTSNWGTTDTCAIGRNTGAAAEYALGYISNAHVVKGTAVYTSAFTPSTTPLTAVSGTSLLTCQSNRFVDNSASPLTITVNGSPSVQRFSPFAPLTVYNPATNGGSGYFDGASDYLTAASAAALGLGSGDFTIELWVYLTANYDATGQGLITASYNTNFAVIGVNTGAGNRIDFYVANTVLNSGANYISLNAWTHLAFVRSSGTTKMYYNGVEKASSASLTGTGAAAAVYVGTLSHDIPRVMTGFMTDARIVKGTAVYTAAFTPNTAPLTAITNTSLLLNYTNAGILDNAMMNDLETVGNAQISTSVKKYGTGSMYFDGTGDNLTTASTPSVWLGGGAFTIEMWLYPNDASSQQMLLSGSDTGSIFLGMNIDGSNRIALGRKGVAVDNFVSYTYVTSAWIHLAITRDSSNNVRFFVNGTQVGSTGTNTNSFTNSALNIGFEPTQKYLNAYIDDLRISKVARYTANFTAPTTAFPNG